MEQVNIRTGGSRGPRTRSGRCSGWAIAAGCLAVLPDRTNDTSGVIIPRLTVLGPAAAVWPISAVAPRLGSREELGKGVVLDATVDRQVGIDRIQPEQFSGLFGLT